MHGRIDSKIREHAANPSSIPPAETKPIEITPQPGDEWEFRLPHMKSKRVKVVGTISEREFIIERAIAYPWNHKTAMLPYVNWERQNKGRYTGITVRRLMEFGRRVSTKAERKAHLKRQIEQAQQKRDAKRQAVIAKVEKG